MISENNVGLKTLLGEGLSEPEFDVDLVYKFNKLIGRKDFYFQFRRIITRYKRIGFNPFMVDNYAGGSGVRLYDGPDLKPFILVGWCRSFLSVAWPNGVQLAFFFSYGVSQLLGTQGSQSSGSLLNLLSLRFLFIGMFIMIYLFVLDDSLTS